MKIFELLSGETGTEAQPQADVAPMTEPSAAASVGPMAQPSQMGQPTQTAGLMDKAIDFFSSPHPIGGAAPTPTPPTPTPPGQPPAQSSGIINRPFGSTAVGQNLDKINTALQPKP
jgi:hypothetical protein